MTDVASTIERYFAVWNECDPARRRELIARDMEQRTPPTSTRSSAAEGRDGAGPAMVGAFLAQMPGARFRAVPSDSTAHHDRVRFGWQLLSQTSDNACL